VIGDRTAEEADRHPLGIVLSSPGEAQVKRFIRYLNVAGDAGVVVGNPGSAHGSSERIKFRFGLPNLQGVSFGSRPGSDFL
jgi:hypothetical protein